QIGTWTASAATPRARTDPGGCFSQLLDVRLPVGLEAVPVDAAESRLVRGLAALARPERVEVVDEHLLALRVPGREVVDERPRLGVVDERAVAGHEPGAVELDEPPERRDRRVRARLEGRLERLPARLVAARERPDDDAHLELLRSRDRLAR